jgi:hypothetical protein
LNFLFTILKPSGKMPNSSLAWIIWQRIRLLPWLIFLRIILWNSIMIFNHNTSLIGKSQFLFFWHSALTHSGMRLTHHLRSWWSTISTWMMTKPMITFLSNTTSNSIGSFLNSKALYYLLNILFFWMVVLCNSSVLDPFFCCSLSITNKEWGIANGMFHVVEPF